MIRHALVLSSLVFLGLTAGCGSDEATPVPPGLQALEAVTVPLPAATAADAHPETFATVVGENDNFEWAQGRGYIHAPLARVFEAMRDADVTTDRRKVSEYTVTPDTEPTYPFSYRVHNIVHDVITIDFDMSWHLGPTAGTDALPTAVSGVYGKTFGSSFIDILRGDIIARRVDDNTTDIEMVREIKSSGAGGPEAAIYLQDCYNSILARVRGQPLPTY